MGLQRWRRRGQPARVWAGGCAFVVCLICLWLAGAVASAAPAAPLLGSWDSAWGTGVNGGSAFGICTVATSCHSGLGGGLGGEILNANTVATDTAGNVYVADTSNQRIQEFDSSGNWIRAWGKGVNGGGAFGICTVAANCQVGMFGGLGGEFNYPTAITVDAAGNVYVADDLNQRIQEFDSSGNWIRAWGKGVNGGSTFGICTVAADCHAGSTGGLGGELNNPVGIAADAAGNVYEAETVGNRVQKFDSSGNWISAWGKGVNGGSAYGICTVAANCHAGASGGLGGEFDSPAGVATAGGKVYLADEFNQRIQEFDFSGNWIRAWGSGVNGGTAFGICTVAANCRAGASGGLGGEFNRPKGVAVDAAGDVYVIEYSGNRVEEFGPSLNWLRAWGKGVNGGSAFGICTVAANCHVGSLGGLGGEFNNPEGIAADAAGDVYVADSFNNRIQRFRDPVLTVSVAGTGAGTVTGTGVSCPGACSRSYVRGTVITLTATPAHGSKFTGWSGGCGGTGACAVTMSADQRVVASFAPLPPPPKTKPSHTRITKTTIGQKQKRATFKFAASRATSFQCALVKAPKKGKKRPKPHFARCSSPKSYKHLKAGKYTFEVRGVNSAGADPKPAIRRFTI
jgi:hypothetical protein